MLTFSYARTEITLTIVLGVLVTALLAVFLHFWALVPAVVTLALLSFYRDPPRQPLTGDDLILAPADGKVVEITRDVAGPDGSERWLRIVIFLAVYNVHVNRSPCAGRVREVTYRAGEFLNALNAAANERNECNLIVIDPRPPLPGPVRVRQIAGVLARRIVCTARPGNELDAGERFGMIKLGSRTEVCLVEDSGWNVAVTVGDKVKAGLTVLARLRQEAPASGPTRDFLAARTDTSRSA